MNRTNETKKQHKPSDFKKNHTVDIIALVLCLAAAFLIWLFVVNSNRTIVEKTIIVTVDAKSQIEDATGLSIINGRDMTDFSQFKVTLKVSGTQSALDRYKDEDYIVRVQTDRLSNVSAGRHDIIFSDAILPSDEITLRSMEPYSFSVLIDQLVEKEVNVTASVGEGGLSDGTLESIDPINSSTGDKIQTVLISGPKSTVDNIEKVTVKVNIANYSKSTVVKSQTFEFTDTAGVPYKNDNSYISVNPSEIDVKLVIGYSNKAVPVSLKFTTTDSDVYKYDVKISLADSTDAAIRLSGDSEFFPDKLEYDLGDITDMTGVTISVEDLIRSDIIPEGLLVNSDDMSKVINITITKDKIVPDTTETSDNTTEAPANSPELPGDQNASEIRA